MIDAGFVMLAMFVLAAIMVWAFFTFTPEYVDEKSVSAYNWSVIAILGLICAAFSFKAFAYLSAPRYTDFLPILLFLANMMILAVGLVVGFFGPQLFYL